MELQPGTVVGDRYAVDAPIGRGGVATVYRVRHLTLDTLHALKVLQHVTGSVQERLLREGKLQGRLGHPNVVAVTDAIDVRGVPALVLELVDGPNLGALLAQRALTVPQIDLLGAQILAGVAAAHEAGLVHRDLKPANVLVARTRLGLVAKVTDFGLARVLDDDLDGRRTRTGAGLGTPQHMAPEQIRDAKDVDERADVWALGTVLYELATGRPAFDDPDRLALFLAIAEGRYTRVEVIRPDLPDRMVHAIGRALSVDRRDRPPHAGALLELWAPATAQDPSLWDAATVELARTLAPSVTSRSSGSPARSSDNRTWVEPPPPPQP
ncbi:MAG: serine/threonine-protein kinase, partial [Myxococcota bacterium]